MIGAADFTLALPIVSTRKEFVNVACALLLVPVAAEPWSLIRLIANTSMDPAPAFIETVAGGDGARKHVTEAIILGASLDKLVGGLEE